MWYESSTEIVSRHYIILSPDFLLLYQNYDHYNLSSIAIPMIEFESQFPKLLEENNPPVNIQAIHTGITIQCRERERVIQYNDDITNTEINNATKRTWNGKVCRPAVL